MRGVSFGNQVRLLSGGEAAFPAMLAAIDGARAEVLLESYIFAQDETGERFMTALAGAAGRGALVRVIVDAVGTIGRLSSSRIVQLEQSGVRVLVYRPLAPWRRRPGLWRRDHRKLLAVDGRVGFVGGLNIADEYNEGRVQARPWRDLHVRIEGPAVLELVRLFVGTWNAESGPSDRLIPPSLRAPRPTPDPAEVGSPVQIVGTRFWPRGGLMRRSFLHAVRRSTTTVAIANPYFVPDRSMMRALTDAAARGVDVRVVIPRRSDVLAIDLAARSMVAPLLRAGVRVAEWPAGMIHEKAAAVDGCWATVGSFNLDHRSLRYNLEVTANLFDGAVASAVQDRILSDFSASVAIDAETLARRPLLARVLSWLLYRLRAWL